MKESTKTSEASKTAKQKKDAENKPNPQHKKTFDELLDLAIKPPKQKG
jgi:hypothetical protein